MATLPEAEPCSAFAVRNGVSNARVSQWVEKGLPVRKSAKTGKNEVLVVPGMDWVRRNVDTAHRMASASNPLSSAAQSPVAPQPSQSSHIIDKASLQILVARARKETAAATRLEIKNDIDRSVLLPRAEVASAVFDFARTIRDSWLSWVSREAQDIADAAGVSVEALQPVLERAVHAHLEDIAGLTMPRVLGNE